MAQPDYRNDFDQSTQSWMQDGADDSHLANLVDSAQLAALNAMIAYSAIKTGRGEFSIARDLADHFGIASMRRLPAGRYIDALTWIDTRVVKAK